MSVQSIDRAMQLLEILSQGTNFALSDLCKKSKLNKTTAFRILHSLKENGYVKQNKKGLYSLTFKMFRVGNRIIQNIDFTQPAKSYITKLAFETNQTIHLVIRDGSQILYIDKFSPENSSNNMEWSKIGRRAPMHCTSAGKAILAYCSEEDINNIWNQTEKIKYTARTIVNLDVLMDNLKLVKKNGYSVEYEEYELGLYCIGCPIFNSKSEVCGALSISIPLSEKEQTKTFFVEKIKDCSVKISKKLGYEGY
ncbi:IclR family transcriptional regulator [Streptobacillus moniliformis]|uniref:Transcriptional regulator, IclR family n=1 Tax=Streptobacillus moniliformis (strain ATCC 14647 / DSM 12112 / NCTC 10651 / 9901) TaxID=519441 RepID=D1AXM2_STRM9|nr:IclR family transcriptional regulator [Streptobacillus moniliformis]ACZ01048.1 transcriptional regulator, IclR family [Streptobacillus moniliformis DSM 12112]AVL42583.1 IclR family transcriptional regulator [Streptobacillus moniliformis]SQA13812.1 Pectin degradation repressor protein kdgR [Streptobacillus moniliformis]